MDWLQPFADSSNKRPQDQHSDTYQWRQDEEVFSLGLALDPLRSFKSAQCSSTKPGFGLSSIPSSAIIEYDDAQGANGALSDDIFTKTMQEASNIAARALDQSRSQKSSRTNQTPQDTIDRIGGCKSSALYAHDVGTYKMPQNSISVLLTAEPPHVIVDVTDMWSEQLSYAKEEVVARTIESVLYGPGTEHQRAAQMQDKMVTGGGCISVLTNYTRSGLPFRNTMLILPIGTHRGVRKPHLLSICTFSFSCGKPMPSPRLQLPEDEPRILSAGVAPYPIVDVNEMWLSNCDFTRDEVVGRTFTILQGPDTEPEVVYKMMNALQHRKNFSGTMTNYTRGRKSMSNTMLIVPVAVVGSDKYYFISTSHFVFHPATQPAKQVADIGAHLTICALLQYA